MRIIIFDVVFTLTSFFSIYFYGSAVYNHAWAQYYEGLAMTALFLLYVQLLCPDPNQRAQYFANIPRKAGGKVTGNGSLGWFRVKHLPLHHHHHHHQEASLTIQQRVWIEVFQVVLTRIATVIAQIVVEATLCPLSETKAHANIAIQVISSFSTGLTVTAIIAFEKRMHKHLANHGHRPLLKLFSFKLVVGLDATQAILFSALADTGTYFPKWPYHVSWNDFAVGIPSFILIWELTIVSFIFLWSFTFEPYKKLALEKGEKVQPQSWRAFIQALDMRDIFHAVIYMFTARGNSEYHEGPVDGRPVQGLPETPASDSDETHINDVHRTEGKTHDAGQL